jgi:UDP-N-acetylglucosamine:LPS N-acetylglucosamine transferase
MATNASASRIPDDRPRRILAIASGGGHWVQLLRLRPAFVGEHVAYATVHRDYRSDVGAAPFYVVPDATRWNRLGLVQLAFRVFRIMLRERPDVVVTTGAAPGYFAVVLGRLFGARTCWIDSMANVRTLSLAGKKAGRFSDLWLTQWRKLSSPEGPQFEGAVL